MPDQRRIIQIAVSSGGPDTHDILYALAADGSLWWTTAPQRPPYEPTEWHPIGELPPHEDDY